MIPAQDAFKVATEKSMPVKVEKAMATLNRSIQHNMNLANFNIRFATQDNNTPDCNRQVLEECIPLLRASGYTCYFDVDHGVTYFNILWKEPKPVQITMPNSAFIFTGNKMVCPEPVPATTERFFNLEKLILAAESRRCKEEIEKQLKCPLMLDLEMLYARRIRAERDLEGENIHTVWNPNIFDFVKIGIAKFKRGAASYTLHGIQSPVALHDIAIAFVNAGYTSAFLGTQGLRITKR